MLPDDDNTLRQVLAQYQPVAPDWLATRIIANAVALKQKQGFVGFIARALTEWNYALPAKGAVLAAFAMLGVLGAQLNSTSHALDPNAIILADPNWTEEL